MEMLMSKDDCTENIQVVWMMVEILVRVPHGPRARMGMMTRNASMVYMRICLQFDHVLLILELSEFRLDRFFRALEQRDQRMRDQEMVGAFHRRTTSNEERKKQETSTRVYWEYEDVIEIMRLGGVQKAMYEIEKMYEQPSSSWTFHIDKDGNRALFASGCRGKAVAILGKITHFNRRRSPDQLKLEATASDRKKYSLYGGNSPDFKSMRNKSESKRSRRNVKFSDRVPGKSLFIGPTPATPPVNKDSKTEKRKKFKSALRCSRRESFDQYFFRLYEEQRIRKLRLLEQLKRGAVLKKYDSQGRKDERWFCVSSDGTELFYARKKPRAMIRKHAKDRYSDSVSTLKNSGISSYSRSYSISRTHTPAQSVVEKATTVVDEENLPQEAELTEDKEHDKALRRRGFSGLFSNHRRKYYCADIVEQYLGPWVSGLRDKDIKPWLFFTLKFPDRILNLQCMDEQQMDVWFLGLQALAPTAPLNPLYLSKGRYLWKRLIMKLEYTCLFL
mmetsp:Transcript_13229/g.18450  ORF Transcript_13229/g.18450 Transcript_13229/m.18450 type:complete len:503 (-) Transcript_13229:293-1801(-)